MRVLLVNKFHYRKGGAETYYLTVGSELERMGHEVAYFSMKHPDNLPCKWDKYFVTQREYNNVKNPFAAARDGMALVYSPEARRNFQTLCEDFRPDVVHLNNVHRQITLSILDVPYISEHKVPVVYTAHDHVTVCPAYLMMDGEGNVCDRCVVDHRFRHCIENCCIKGSRVKSALAVAEASFCRAHGSYDKIDVVIAPSEYMRNTLIQGGWPAGKVIARKNFASKAIFERAWTVASIEKRESPYFLFFGRVSVEKGIDLLVPAFVDFSRAFPGWRLVIAGDGPDAASLAAQIDSLGMASRIEYVGFKHGRELQSIIANAAFSVSASRCRENMPYSVIESFAAGTPAIGSRIGGIPELILENETGYLCEPADMVSMQRALCLAAELFQDEMQYADMSRRCQQYVSHKCSQDAYMNDLVDLYQSMLPN